METFTVTVGNYSVDLDPKKDYMLYGAPISVRQLVKEDFSHIKERLDQRLLIQSLRIWNNVPVMFHAKVLKSLHVEQENSIYYNKTQEEMAIVFRRDKTSDRADKKEQVQLNKDVDLTDQVVLNRKYRCTNKLVDMGYDRTIVMEMFETIFEEQGTGIMGLKPARIIEILDERLIKTV